MSVESIRARDVEALGANVWTLSPPCQPFTRNNTTSVRTALALADAPLRFDLPAHSSAPKTSSPPPLYAAMIYPRRNATR